eukprot:COSAG01_NODE_24931_length_761_cov_1.077039_1_plen_48_part_10
MAQRSLGQPYDDALETSALLESRMLEKEEMDIHSLHPMGLHDLSMDLL